MTERPRKRRHSTAEPVDLQAERETVTERLENELSDLAGLYVASSQLAGSQSARAAVRHLCELLEQFVGAQAFAIYVLTRDGRTAWRVAAHGRTDQAAELPAQGGRFGDVCLTGVAAIGDPSSGRTAGQALVVLPLVFDDEVVGVVTIDELFAHKPAWARIDRELFKLLSAQGAAALVAANLYESADSPRVALADLRENLRRTASPSDPTALARKGSG